MKLKTEKTMLNISKTREFPDWEYFVYDLKRKEIGNYINVWFPKIKHIKDFSTSKKITENFLVRDDLWTIKFVDEATASHLYGRKLNPVRVGIFYPTGKNMLEYAKKGLSLDEFKDKYTMKAQIHSVDDSSYGVWFTGTVENLKEIRIQILKYVDSVKVLNGNEFLNKCIELGADKDSVDYN